MGRPVVTAREIALRPLDLDDAGAGVGQARGQEGRGDGLFDGDDKNVFQDIGHRGPGSAKASGVRLADPRLSPKPPFVRGRRATKALAPMDGPP